MLLTKTNVQEPGFGFMSQGQAIGNTPSHFIPKGRAYAFDEQGKLLWPAPLKIRNRWFPLAQPEGVPVIAFAQLQYEQFRPNQYQTKTHLLCVEKRSGRILYRSDDLQQSYSVDIVGDPEKKTVEVRLQNETVKLAFTDKPIPSKSSGQTDPGSDWPTRSKSVNALWKVLDKSLRSNLP